MTQFRLHDWRYWWSLQPALWWMLALTIALTHLACARAGPDERDAAQGRSPADALAPEASAKPPSTSPYLVVLGTSQDGGTPQIGGWDHAAWSQAKLERRVSSLGVVDPQSGQRWLFDATPDLRRQLAHLSSLAPASRKMPNAGLAGVFLTHAHWGHYSGLGFLGHEVMGASGVDVYVMPRFRSYLETNGPWDQLVRYENIRLTTLAAEQSVQLKGGLRVTPFPVPHRQEYSEVVGFRIDGPNRSVLFLPDIDSWREWEAQQDSSGTLINLETVLGSVDVAYVDATFYADGEVAGRDMSGFPHPFIAHTMERLKDAPRALREKVRFIHLNHTNPAQFDDSEARATLEAAGFKVAEQGELVAL